MKRLTRAIALLAMALLLCAHGTPICDTLHRAPTAQSDTDSTAGTVTAAAAKQQTPEEYYRTVWSAAKDNFLWQNRMADWPKWEHKFDGKLATFNDAENAINQMLGTLNDPYTYFKDANLTAARGVAAERKNVVSYNMLPNDIGYIRIQTFGTVHTSDEVEAALKALPKAKAYVIDLRDNGGGYIWQAFRVFALFTDKGTFSTLKGMSNGQAYTEVLELTAKELIDNENGNAKKHTRPDNLAGTKPVVILVNGDSASASEMLTGALRDNGRAKVVGTQTFGKGIAQITVNLERKTSVQITFAEYFFPSGASIHGKGIRPDSQITRGSRGDLQLDEAVKIAKEELKK
jgi:C-terminal processing protease CtpA/Prc